MWEQLMAWKKLHFERNSRARPPPWILNIILKLFSAITDQNPHGDRSLRLMQEKLPEKSWNCRMSAIKRSCISCTNNA